MLHSVPRGSLCAEAFTAIEADLEAFSPGRAAAGGGHGGACGRRPWPSLLPDGGELQALAASSTICAANCRATALKRPSIEAGT